MSSAAVYFLFSEMLNLSFRHDIIFSGNQQTQVGSNLLTATQQKGKGRTKPSWIDDIIVHSGPSPGEISIYSENELHKKMQIKWNLLSEIYK